MKGEDLGHSTRPNQHPPTPRPERPELGIPAPRSDSGSSPRHQAFSIYYLFNPPVTLQSRFFIVPALQMRKLRVTEMN